MARSDKAARRFWLLQAVRLLGIAMVLCGAMAVAGRLGLNEAQGAVLFVGGAVTFFGVPVLLSKHWQLKE